MLTSLCSVLVMAISLILTIMAFYHIFQGQKPGESELNVIQRQLRGFALLIVANLVMMLGMVVCAGSFIPDIKKIWRE